MKRILICSAAGVAAMLCALPVFAAGDPSATAAPSVLGWPEYLAIALAALAGVRTIVDVLLAGFRWLAPRTTTTADDTIRDDLQLAHDKLDALTALVGGIVPGRKPQSGRVRGSLLSALGMAGLLALACGSGLTAKGVAIAGKDALINCGETEGRNILVQRVVPIVLQVLVNSTSPDGKLIDTAPIKSAIGKIDKGDAYDEARIVLTCAAKVAFAKLAAPTVADPGAPQAAALVADRDAVLRAEADVMATVAPGARFSVEVR